MYHSRHNCSLKIGNRHWVSPQPGGKLRQRITTSRGRDQMFYLQRMGKGKYAFRNRWGRYLAAEANKREMRLEWYIE